MSSALSSTVEVIAIASVVDAGRLTAGDVAEGLEDD